MFSKTMTVYRLKAKELRPQVRDGMGMGGNEERREWGREGVRMGGMKGGCEEGRE